MHSPGPDRRQLGACAKTTKLQTIGCSLETFIVVAIPKTKSSVLGTTVRNARITKAIPLEYFDAMHTKSLRKMIPTEFSDVMVT